MSICGSWAFSGLVQGVLGLINFFKDGWAVGVPGCAISSVVSFQAYSVSLLSCMILAAERFYTLVKQDPLSRDTVHRGNQD